MLSHLICKGGRSYSALVAFLIGVAALIILRKASGMAAVAPAWDSKMAAVLGWHAQEGPGQNNWAYNLAERLLPGMQGGMPAAEAVPAACAQRSFGHASSAAPGCGQPQSMPLQAAEQVL